ncbi:MAG TPA: SLBB domain-containing protein [Gemmatimonadales bacterium]|nr:SLBB domain-containing protein [Gemmatimonadales bacterium]
MPRLLSWLVAVCLLLVSSRVAAQIPGLPPGAHPSPQEVQTLLETRPDLVAQLRQKIAESGLTPDQVRARLKAAGYPEDLLDAYIGGADTTAATPTATELGGFSALGLLSVGADTLGRLDTLGFLSGPERLLVDSLRRRRADSLRADSLGDTLEVRGGLKRFGIEVFRRASTRFQAFQPGPVDQNYRLGAGDLLVLILTGEVELTRTLEVNREGFVMIPQVGQVYAANLTLGQLEDQLYTRLGRVYSGVRRGPNPRTRFSITVARLRTIQVYVVGDVVRPGAYQMSAAGTVLTGLYAAGGPPDNGSLRHIEVRRGGTLLDSVDVYDYLLRGINRSDLHLESGDVIFVPVRGPLVAVTGRVVRPAIYEIKAGETLRDVIAAAGGLDATAVEGRIQIHRILPQGTGEAGQQRVVIDVSSPGLAAGEIPAFPISPGDSVRVFEVPPHVSGFVTVRGNVVLPSRVGFTAGMKLSDAVRLAGGPKPDVYLGRILISRLQADSSRVQLHSAFADSTGRVTDDLALQDGDDIRVFSRSTFRTQPWVTIVGAVKRSGRVSYHDGLTLRDALLLADGLSQDAVLDSVEIARLPESRPTGALAQTIRVSLDSSYVFTQPGAERPAGIGHEIILQPYDNVLIMRRPGWDLQRLVAITGQVEHPGRYALTSKTERLSDLLGRAGGLTTEAYAGGIEFYRRAATAKVTPAPVDPRIPIQPLPPGFAARVGLDLPRVLKEPGFRDNIILASGDSIYIPEFNPLVQVQGTVNAPGPVAYTPGKNLDWYVQAAGGYGETGDRTRAFVTQPDGKREAVHRRFFFGDDVPTPNAGAVITVPERKAPPAPSNAGTVLGVLASVLASLTTVIVVLKP